MEQFINGLLGTVISVLLAILTGQIVAVRKEQKQQSTTLTAHILQMSRELATKVDLSGCRVVRGECIALNKEIIVKPLTEAISEVEKERKDSWERQRQENRTIWAAIRAHIHTDIPTKNRGVGQGVILPPDGLPQDQH